MKPLLFLFLLAATAHAAETGFLAPPTPRPLFRLARPDGSLLQLDEAVLDRLLHRSRQGDIFTIPLPDGDATLTFDHESIDPKSDLDCCSVTLGSAGGGTTIPLTRSLSPRDFEVRYNGRTYHVRGRGNGNYGVGPY